MTKLLFVILVNSFKFSIKLLVQIFQVEILPKEKVINVNI